MKIEALHNFHEQKFSQDWSDKFKPSAERLSLFQMILDNIDKRADQQSRILELGIGSGYLADYILAKCDNLIYEGLDFSEAMLDIAKRRLTSKENKLIFTKADLTDETWINKIKSEPKHIVSTWALHDLLCKENIFKVYKSAFDILPLEGTLINGDFIKPEHSIFEYEKGRIKPSEHLKLLRLCGFTEVKCLNIFEENADKPTTSNNYACFVAIK